MDDIIGRMRRRLTIEAPVEAPDGAGGVLRSFAEDGEIWAAVEPLGGGLHLAGDRAAQTLTHRILMRSGPALTVQHRLKDGTRIHAVRSVHTADAEGRFLVALTEEMTG